MMNLRDRTIKIGERSVSYVEGGNGPSLVYVHGWTSGVHCDDSRLLALAEDFHLYAPKLPGFGDSDLLSVRHTIDAYASFLEDFINALGLEKVFLMGHSLGGAIGLTFALENQEKIGALVLVGAPGSFRYLADRKVKTAASVLSFLFERFKAIGGFLTKIINNDRCLGLVWPLITPRDPGYQRLKDDLTTVDLRKIPLSVSKEVLDSILRFDLIPRCGKLRDLPVLLLAGQNDVLVPVAAVEEIDKAIGTSIFMIVPYADHWSILGNDSLRIIKNFLKSNKGDGEWRVF